MGPFEVLCSIAVIILFIYYYLTSTFDFWKSRGICSPQPIPLFGNVKDLMLARKNIGDYTLKIYNEFKDERMIGLFSRREPVLLLKDLNLIKDVLIKDFSVFPERAGFNITTKAEPLSQHLAILEAKRWRPLRTRLSPVFTSGKLKKMFPLILECSNHLEQNVEKLAGKNEPVECRELTAKYTTDVIGSCAFGIEMNALSDEKSEFRRMGRILLTPSWFNIIQAGLRRALPRFFNMLSYILPQTEVTKFFLQTITENMEYREKNNIVRHDFVDMLREIKKHPEKLDIELTDSLLASQAFVFFIAGFETSSTTITHALYELALNPKVQDKLREEIHNEFARNGNKLTYDNVKKMKYLDKVFKETLRKYPPGSFLTRRSICNYTFNGTNVNIPEGQRIWIPVFAIHRDARFYPEPDVFDPERFNEDVMQARHPICYIPFGDGPRNCIGIRFAVYQSKIGLIKILQNHKVETCEKTQIPYITDPKAFLLLPKNGIYLRITKLDQL